MNGRGKSLGRKQRGGEDRVSTRTRLMMRIMERGASKRKIMSPRFAPGGRAQDNSNLSSIWKAVAQNVSGSIVSALFGSQWSDTYITPLLGKAKQSFLMKPSPHYSPTRSHWTRVLLSISCPVRYQPYHTAAHSPVVK